MIQPNHTGDIFLHPQVIYSIFSRGGFGFYDEITSFSSII